MSYPDLSTAVATSFSNILASGMIEKAIEEELSKTISSLIKEQLRSYSDFGEQLKAAVKDAMKIDLQNLGIPSYNDLILKVLRNQVDALAHDAIAEQVEKQMTDLLQPAPKEIKLSELVASFIESNKSSTYCSCDAPSSITLFVEESQYSSRWIRLDKEPGVRKDDCKISFGVSDHDNRMFGLRLDRSHVDKTLFLGLYGFDRKIFQMYAAGTKLIVDGDQHDINKSYHDSDD